LQLRAGSAERQFRSASSELLVVQGPTKHRGFASQIAQYADRQEGYGFTSLIPPKNNQNHHIHHY
jgi:hypothetical protein